MTHDEAVDLAIQLARWTNHTPDADRWTTILTPLQHGLAVRTFTRLLERPDAIPGTTAFHAEYETCQRREHRPIPVDRYAANTRAANATTTDPADPRRLSAETIELGNRRIAELRAQLTARRSPTR